MMRVYNSNLGKLSWTSIIQTKLKHINYTYRVIHNGCVCKDDLKLIKFDGYEVKSSLLPGTTTYSTIKQKRSLQLPGIVNNRKLTV